MIRLIASWVVMQHTVQMNVLNGAARQPSVLHAETCHCLSTLLKHYMQNHMDTLQSPGTVNLEDQLHGRLSVSTFASRLSGPHVMDVDYRHLDISSSQYALRKAIVAKADDRGLWQLVAFWQGIYRDAEFIETSVRPRTILYIRQCFPEYRPLRNL